MGTALDDPALADKVNLVALLNRAQAMCDRDGRSALGSAVEGVLDDTFAVAVQGRGRLVQQEDRRVSEKSTSNRNTFCKKD